MQLTISISTRNRANQLAEVLDSLLEQRDKNLLWEVIVVDNGSTDNTAEVVSKFGEKAAFPVRHVLEERIGLHNARNRGLLEARGEFISYLDDDMPVAADWLSGARLLIAGEASAVMGRIVARFEIDPPDWMPQIGRQGENPVLGILDLGEEELEIPPHLVYGGGCFYPKSLILELGGFHPDGMPEEMLRYRGDGENGLTKKVAERGLRCVYDPTAVTYHCIGKHKLTKEYFQKRSYMEGISRSYSQIRNIGDLRDDLKPSGLPSSGMSVQEANGDFAKSLDEAFLAGWQFHQQEVREDPSLLEYVLRETYLEQDDKFKENQ